MKWQSEYKVPAGTAVRVSDPERFLKSHTLKKEMVFSRTALLKDVEEYFTFPKPSGCPGDYECCFPKNFYKEGYLVFVTEHPKWPWMVVPKSVFKKHKRSKDVFKKHQRSKDKDDITMGDLYNSMLRGSGTGPPS